jgi:hypothetical protein
VQVIAEGLMGQEGAPVRARAVEALSPIVRWRLVPAAAAMLLRTVAAAVWGVLCALTGRPRHRSSLLSAARSVSVVGVRLGRVPVKRALLVAAAAFSKLWQQSKLVALRSCFMAAWIALAALLHPVAATAS